MFTMIRSAIMCLLIMAIITGLAYPLFITVIGAAVFEHKAQGSLIVENGKVTGSELIGQSFEGEKYFWPRPSATSSVTYNSAASGGSNFGPSNPKFVEAVKERIEKLKGANTGNQPIPIDLVTASGSGLDPDIRPAAAQYQVSRVAKARGMSEKEVGELVTKFTERRQWGIFGEKRVNVLRLNLELDKLTK